MYFDLPMQNAAKLQFTFRLDLNGNKTRCHSVGNKTERTKAAEQEAALYYKPPYMCEALQQNRHRLCQYEGKLNVQTVDDDSGG